MDGSSISTLCQGLRGCSRVGHEPIGSRQEAATLLPSIRPDKRGFEPRIGVRGGHSGIDGGGARSHGSTTILRCTRPRVLQMAQAGAALEELASTTARSAGSRWPTVFRALPSLLTRLPWTPIFAWAMRRHGSCGAARHAGGAAVDCYYLGVKGTRGRSSSCQYLSIGAANP